MLTKLLKGCLRVQTRLQSFLPETDLKEHSRIFYNEKGYYPALHPGETETDPTVLGKRGQKRSAVAITLGDSYDAWALSEMAKELGNQDISARFAPKAQNYKKSVESGEKIFYAEGFKGQLD